MKSFKTLSNLLGSILLSCWRTDREQAHQAARLRYLEFRVEACRIIRTHGIPCVVWAEDALAHYGVPTMTFGVCLSRRRGRCDSMPKGCWIHKCGARILGAVTRADAGFVTTSAASFFTRSSIQPGHCCPLTRPSMEVQPASDPCVTRHSGFRPFPISPATRSCRQHH